MYNNNNNNKNVNNNLLKKYFDKCNDLIKGA